jgi:hypothetical protein
MTRSRRVADVAAVFAACIAILAAAPPARADRQGCEIPAGLLQVEVKLPHLSERVHAHQPVTIVAIGGASTIGAAAGSPDLAYPHRMQLALAEAFPNVPITVVNKGVPRQSAHQMLERFATDVVAEDPVLVVWETGIVDAVRGIEIDDFATAVQDGMNELKNRSIDTLLVDMQFSRKTITLIDFDKYLTTLHHLGESNDVYVFPRFEMMRYWSEQNTFNFDEVAPNERADLAARVYECIGRKLASAIRLAVQ